MLFRVKMKFYTNYKCKLIGKGVSVVVSCVCFFGCFNNHFG